MSFGTERIKILKVWACLPGLVQKDPGSLTILEAGEVSLQDFTSPW